MHGAIRRIGFKGRERGVSMGQRKAIVVGSGAGGCMAERELAGCGYNVMLIEAGGDFKPFTKNMDLMEPARRARKLDGWRAALAQALHH